MANVVVKNVLFRVPRGFRMGKGGMAVNRRSLFRSLVGIGGVVAVAARAEDAKVAPTDKLQIPAWSEALLAEPKWVGDPPQGSVTADHILQSSPWKFSEEELEYWIRFYDGDQWPSEAAEARRQSKRPALVINKLPAIVASALAVQHLAGLCPPSASDMRRLMAIVARRNADAQVLYNWVHSARVEEIRRVGTFIK